MGLFSGKSESDKAREFATKKGVDTAGAVEVGRTFYQGADQVMVVRPEGVEVHHLGKVGTLTRKGAGVLTIPADRVGSVSTRRDGVWSYLRVDGSGQDAEFRCDLETSERLATALRSLGRSAPAAPPSAPAVPAGWYPDQAAGVQRWWDGQAWTEHTAPMP